MKQLEIRRDGGSRPMIRAEHACSFLNRTRGLLGKNALAVGRGMLISPCNQVHTIGMRFPLDVVYLDSSGVILKCVEQLKPFRLSSSLRARHTLELAVNSIQQFQLKPGDRLIWE